ncbi:protein of unknown function [Marivirga sericea]|uniref:DUF4365 domain-containing protein n=1 Tax=Marivirga sericea TaxID=1028 RepID=A0A1X7JR40_9BACT|nr:DUF4365 domain-containing protein [Marivirga sericea]SMG30804.1 protein of unknown function [Marivirga sericea]
MRANNTDRIGVHAVGYLISKQLNWIFREQPIVDVGIDALIEEAVEGNPTGKFLAAQIKSGTGNFHGSERYYTLYVSKVHYNYWLNLDLPIILIAYIPETDDILWELINEQNLLPTEKRWKIDIPKNKPLNKESHTELARIINSDFQENFMKDFYDGEISDQEIEKILESVGSISKSEACTLKMTDIVNGLGEETRKITAKIHEYVDLGYHDSDPRVKKVIKRFSAILVDVARKLDHEIDQFADYFSEGIRACEKLVMIYFELTQDYKAIQELNNSTLGLVPAMDEAIDGIKFMRNEISSLPSKFANLKKAKQRSIVTLNSILAEHKAAKMMVEDFNYQLKKILD